MNSIHHPLNSAQRTAARATLRRVADESLAPSELAADIAQWARQRALWSADLAAGDFRHCDEAALRGGIAYADARLGELHRQAQRHLRAQAQPGYPPQAARSDFTARFKAARYVDVVDVAQTLTGQTAVNTGNGRYRIRCPFHDDDSPSLVLYPPGKGWHCFGCGRGGDAVAFVAEHLHCGMVEALRMLEELADTYPDAWGQAS
jgi:hypothetical protein